MKKIALMFYIIIELDWKTLHEQSDTMNSTEA